MNYTPLMQQYMDIKKEAGDCILFFRLGDFYEMFGEDAKTASKELDITLTSRDRTNENRIPMCGVPYHSSDAYIARLITKGYRVAICEQTEDPSKAKGLVKREIVRIVTPGTVIDSSMLEEGKYNYISSVYMGKTGAGVCFADISAGLVYATNLEGKDFSGKILNELGRYTPSEAVLCENSFKNESVSAFLKRLECMAVRGHDGFFDSQKAHKLILKQFKANSLDELGISEAPYAVCALGGLLSYLYDTQKTDLSQLTSLDYYSKDRFMELDYTARRNLEITQNIRTGDKTGTLLGAIDLTKSSMGSRLLRKWLENPLINPAPIKRRHKAVAEILTRPEEDRPNKELASMPDMERLISRVVVGTANCRDLNALCRAFLSLPAIKTFLKDAVCHQLGELYSLIDPLSDLCELIECAITDDPPFSVREGGIIRDGYNAEVDRLRGIIKNGQALVAKMEAEEREKTGIKNLKIGYNKVFGYYIEVSRSGLDSVPQTYIRKQTLSNCERFINDELKHMEAEILGARDKIKELEFELFTEVRIKIAGQVHRIQRTAGAVGSLDVLLSFAEAAKKYDYHMPEVDYSDIIDIKDGRHPVVEQSGTLFVPNDTYLDCGENTAAIITGPNMAGKSTYMRQTAIIVLMAQAGSFVPARYARIGLVDRIFTRIGASDDIASGRSTFMVEMSEMADILKNATKRSLLILDEIGRGTSTFDGMSIARAVLEYAADKKYLGAKTLFATHYHELTELEQTLSAVKNYNIAAKKRGDDIIFLRKIVRGGADDSYGIEVAKLAGVPQKVILRAREVLGSLESGEIIKSRKPAIVYPEDNMQISLTETAGMQALKRLKDIDINTISPLEAMNILYELQKAVKSEN